MLLAISRGDLSIWQPCVFPVDFVVMAFERTNFQNGRFCSRLDICWLSDRLPQGDRLAACHRHPSHRRSSYTIEHDSFDAKSVNVSRSRYHTGLILQNIHSINMRRKLIFALFRPLLAFYPFPYRSPQLLVLLSIKLIYMLDATLAFNLCAHVHLFPDFLAQTCQHVLYNPKFKTTI